jgi:hypothetical protein
MYAECTRRLTKHGVVVAEAAAAAAAACIGIQV